MNKFLSISFSDKIKNFKSYFKNYDKEKYKGGLQKNIDLGNYIWLDNRLLITIERLDEQKKWLENYEKLINVYGLLNDDHEQLNRIVDSRDSFYIFNELVKIDPNNKYGFNLIMHFFKIVLKQPLFYLEMIKKDEIGLLEPQRIYNRYKMLNGCISYEKHKFLQKNQIFKANLITYLRNDSIMIERLLKEVILATEEFLINIFRYSQNFSFEYISSPSFVVYMDFVKDVQCYLKFLNSNGNLPLINKYFIKIEDYRNQFEIQQIPKTIFVEEKIYSLSEMFEKRIVLKTICKKLDEKGFIKTNSEGKYLWQGNPLSKRGRGLQLVALSLCCDKYLKKAYNSKVTHKAYSSYFNYEISANPFKDSETGNAEKYKYLFAFIDQIQLT